MTATADNPEERERVLNWFTYELRAIRATEEELELVDAWFSTESPRLPQLVTDRVLALRVARDLIARAAAQEQP